MTSLDKLVVGVARLVVDQCPASLFMRFSQWQTPELNLNPGPKTLDSRPKSLILHTPSL